MTEEQLIDAYIELDSWLPGVEEARIIGYGVPVWALIGHRQAIAGDVDEVAQDYDLPREAVKAAFAYYRRHQAALDARIAANAA
jgi:uncharacterized protein (DUF433 family)